MIDIQTLTPQVKKNCNISDAHYWGWYSVCGLLLRLRELYRSERGMKLWEGIRREDISQWIEERENLWKEFEGREFQDIVIDGKSFSPFEVKEINSVLNKENLLYGAGYGIHMKPSFFLSDLLSCYSVDGHAVYIGGKEYARDLADHPAMVQDGVIYGRLETTKLHLWEKFEELKSKGPDSPLTFAFSKYNITKEEGTMEELEKRMSELSLSELETYIHHEVGEAFEGELLDNAWQDLLLDCSGTKAEHFARGVKDLLSDTSEKGMAKYIIEHKKEGSLGFYIVFLQGYRRVLFTEIKDAFQRFTSTADWELIEEARQAGYRNAKSYAERLLSLYNQYRTEKEQLLQCIEQDILKGLL
jgi:hypothetical protein